jgi:hypothetical protein
MWAFLVGLAVVLAAGSACAAPVIYASPSDDGSRPPVPPAYPAGGNWTTYIYMADDDPNAVATVVGDPCDDGDGAERCGWQLLFVGDLGASVVSYTPTVGSDQVFGSDLGRIQVNGGAFDAGELGAVRLGELTITGPEGSRIVVFGTVVGADLGKHQIGFPTPTDPPVIAYLPEPTAAPGLALGIGMLALIARRRSGTTRAGLESRHTTE